MENLDDLARLPDPADGIFDASGLLVGDVGDHVWPQVCLKIEADLEERGWDQPTQVLVVTNSVDTEAMAGFDVATVLADMNAEPGDGTDVGDFPPLAFGIVPLGQFRGHPVEELWGFTAPPWASALVLAFEGWVVPALFDEDGNELPDEHGHLPNSEHPRRYEQRSVTMVTRDGATYTAERSRGEEPRIAEGTPVGVLMDVIHRTLGLPTDPPSLTVPGMLGRMALASATGALADVTDEADLSRRSAAAAEWAAGMRELIADLDDASRAETLEAVFVTALRSSIAHLAWMATGHGELGVPKPARRRLRDLARHVAAGDDLDVLWQATRAAAQLPFNDLLANKHSRQLLPADLTQTPPGWADEGALSRRLLWRHHLPSQRAILAEVSRRLGTVPEAVTQTLEDAGWAETSRTDED